jgi:hypothetical protein
MKNLPILQSRRALPLLACLFLFAGPPLASEAFGDDFVRQVKVKDHKVKVKTVGGKAKIKSKANGKEKFKAKGPNGAFAADIARANAGLPYPGPPLYPVPYYK